MARFARGGTRGSRVKTWYSSKPVDMVASIDPNDSNTTGILVADYDEVRLRTDAAPTLIRIRGSLQVLINGSSLDDPAGVSVAFGIIPIAEFSNPPAPNPAENQNLDWLWWHVQTFSNFNYSGLNSSNAIVTAGVTGVSFEPTVIDSKAMRKIQPGWDLVLCVKCYANANVSTVQVIPGLRCLWMG